MDMTKAQLVRENVRLKLELQNYRSRDKKLDAAIREVVREFHAMNRETEPAITRNRRQAMKYAARYLRALYEARP